MSGFQSKVFRHVPVNGHIPENRVKMPLTSYHKRANYRFFPKITVDMLPITGTASFSRVDTLYIAS
mgnify:CR=1 FL=1